MSVLETNRHGGILELRLNDPARRNVLSRPMCVAISDAIRTAADDREVRAIVITGALPAFCAGADLEDLEDAARGHTANVEAVYQAFMDVADCNLPTIAAVNGPAVGAGLNLALACDVRVASSNAMFDTRFLDIGLHPGGGHTWMLLRAVGWSTAANMLLLGQKLNASQAAANGLVQSVVDPEHLMGAALALASGSERFTRELIIETKRSLRFAAHHGHHDTFALETQAQLHSLQGPAFRELVARLRANLGERKDA